jgi:hypothetical protein
MRYRNQKRNLKIEKSIQLTTFTIIQIFGLISELKRRSGGSIM